MSVSDEDRALIARCIELMAEKFSHVQVFVTKDEEDMSIGYWKGAGNVYAREGIVRAWLERQAESERIQERSNNEETS